LLSQFVSKTKEELTDLCCIFVRSVKKLPQARRLISSDPQNAKATPMQKLKMWILLC
jgi:hypothetical protein